MSCSTINYLIPTILQLYKYIIIKNYLWQQYGNKKSDSEKQMNNTRNVNTL